MKGKIFLDISEYSADTVVVVEGAANGKFAS